MTYVYREGLGRPLTWDELDGNFRTGALMSEQLAAAVQLKASSGANSDITSLSGITTPLSISQGGTGGGNQSDALIALGVSGKFVSQDSSTGAAAIPAGTSAERPSSPSPGMIRYNTSASRHERRVGASWLYHGDMDGPLNEAALSTVAASSIGTISLLNNTITVTGTTTITSLGSTNPGITRRLIFTTSLVLTHNSTSLILPGGANITTQPGDVAEFISLGSGNWRCFPYMRASVAP